MKACITLTALLTLLVTAIPTVRGAPQGFDLVTMKNGDIFNGTVAQQAFSIFTGYGMVTIPYGMMAELHTGAGDRPGRLITRLGDSYRGRVQRGELTLLRLFDPALPLNMAAISEIIFTPHRTRFRPLSAPDAIESRTGDRFFARILNRELLLQGEKRLFLVKKEDIHLVDIETSESSNLLRAQIIKNGGRRLHGRPMDKSIRVIDRYGNALTAPVAQIDTLAFQVNYPGQTPNFRFRQNIAPSSLLRDSMRDGTPGPELAVLRGGPFRRGDFQGDGDADELPLQQLRLRPFAIGLYEVTFDEFDLFCEATGRDKPDDAGWGRGRRPVVNVSWNEAKAFTAWLSQRTGKSYRLPTDAEWEYAARGGTTSRFWWGDEPGTGNANCEGCGSLWDGEKTVRVGKFRPNTFGLHDMAGNVFEWVEDCWHDSFAAVPLDGAMLDKPNCGKRVIRGGAWSFPPHEIRSANRWRDFPSRHSDDTGFRVVRELPVSSDQ